METMINVIVIIFTLMVVLYVEIAMSHTPTEKEVSDYQRVLDKADSDLKTKHGIEYSHDAKTELITQRRQSKSFALIFSGIFLAFVLIGLIFLSKPSLINIGLICVSAIVLIIYGMIKIAESKRFAIEALAFIFILGSVVNFALSKFIIFSPYAYFYLCGLVVLLGAFSFLTKFKSKTKLLVIALVLLATSQSRAEENDNKEFKKLYKQTVTKLSSENRDTVEFRVFRLNETAIVKMVYQKTNACLCNDKLCHGPRLILSANFGRTSIFVFPNGYCFAATNNFNPGADIVKVDIHKAAASEASFKEAAKKTLSDYTK